MTVESILKEADAKGFMLHQLIQLDTTIYRCNFKAKFCNDKGQPFFWYGGADENADPVKCMAAALKYAVEGCPEEPTESNVPTPFPTLAAPNATGPTLDEHIDKMADLPPHCAVCGEPQFKAPGGMVCKNGHGGALSLFDDTPVAPASSGGLFD